MFHFIILITIQEYIVLFNADRSKNKLLFYQLCQALNFDVVPLLLILSRTTAQIAFLTVHLQVLIPVWSIKMLLHLGY